MNFQPYQVLDSPLVIDNVLPSNIADSYSNVLLNNIELGLGGSGTSTISHEWCESQGLNNIYEQFQLINLVKGIEDNNPLNTQMWHLITLPFTLACLKLGIYYFTEGMLKCKINIQTRAPEKSRGKYNFPHTDYFGNKSDSITALYYVNDSDGDTYFFNKFQYNEDDDKIDISQYKNLKIVKQISPKKGRMVLFNTSQLHSGSHPIDHDKRIVINYNCITFPFFTDKEKEKNLIQNVIKQ